MSHSVMGKKRLEKERNPVYQIHIIFIGCGESIKDLVFGGSVLGGSVFLTSDDLINRIPKTKPLKPNP